MGARNKQSRLRDSRVWDLAAGTPLILLCAFGIAGFAIQIHRQWPAAAALPDYAVMASEVSGGLFLAMQLVLTCVRRPPRAKSPGLLPRLLALVGANSSYTVLLLPKVPLDGGAAMLSASVIAIGALGSAAVLIWLGRSFAIFPQARMPVTKGPYRLVRHPLYLCEQVSLFGVSMQYAQPWALLIVLLGFALQFPRMRYEEEILGLTFPLYRDYARRTPMILPRIGW
jgi:protein-S-isoprenylcysteine O-methyltransferase Ste14